MKRKIPQENQFFVYDNANPKDKVTTDCVIRAISVGTGLSWDDVFKGLATVAMKYKLSMGDSKCYGRYLAGLGYIQMKQPRKADNTKYTGREFIKTYTAYNSRPVIAHIGGHHLTAIKNGKIHDTWDCSYGTIGIYWIKD